MTLNQDYVKVSIFNILTQLCYSATKDNQNDVINVFKYLFKNIDLNINDYFRFSPMMCLHLSKNCKIDLAVYLLDFKTGQDFIFKDTLLQLKDKDSYAYECFLSVFNKRESLLIKDINTLDKDSMLIGGKKILSYPFFDDRKDISEKARAHHKASTHARELHRKLLNFSDKSYVKNSLNSLSSISKEQSAHKELYNLLTIVRLFYHSFNIDERITFLTIKKSLTKETDQIYRDTEDLLKILGDVQKLIKHGIIKSSDLITQEMTVNFLCDSAEYSKEYLEKASTDFSKALYKADMPIASFQTIIDICEKYTVSPSTKILLYIEQSCKFLNLKNEDLEKIAFWTKKSVTLAESFVHDSNNVIIKDVYWNRAEYYWRIGDNDKCISDYIKYIEMLDDKHDKDNYADILTIVKCTLSMKGSDKIIDKLFVALNNNDTQVESFEERKILFNNFISNKLPPNYYNEQVLQSGYQDTLDVLACKAIEAGETIGIQGRTIMILDLGGTNNNYKEADFASYIQRIVNKINDSHISDASFLFKELLIKLPSNNNIQNEHIDIILCTLYLIFASYYINLNPHKHYDLIKEYLCKAEELEKDIDLSSYYIEFNSKVSNELSLIDDNILIEAQKNQIILDLIDIEEVLNSESSNMNIEQDIELRKKNIIKANSKLFKIKQRDLYEKLNIKSDESHYYSWKIGKTTYSTKDPKVIDLGNNKYCVIHEKLNQKISTNTMAIFQNTAEKNGLINNQSKQGVKKAGNIMEIKIRADSRLHNNNIHYLNDKDKTLIIFTKEGNHVDIKKLSVAKIQIVPVQSSIEEPTIIDQELYTQDQMEIYKPKVEYQMELSDHISLFDDIDYV